VPVAVGNLRTAGYSFGMHTFQPERLFCFLALLCATAFPFFITRSAQAEEKPIRVLVWDEQQPGQKPAYDNFLGNAIADHLKSRPGFEVKSVRLDDPDQGLTDDELDHTDVVIWWGHIRHRDVKPENAKKIVDRIVAGKLSLIALHSAHWSQPFVQAMFERTREDALKAVPENQRASATFEYINPIPYTPVKKDTPLTPRIKLEKQADGTVKVVVHMPGCIFPAWRADGKPSHVKTLLPDHPIAAGIPKEWDVAQTEMYDEPFHVPTPDAVIFEEHWDAGEHFRSGCLWNVGKGKVFYFRPGHEAYPVYKQDIPLKILENACRFLAGK
jgi:trehalose utilization protein